MYNRYAQAQVETEKLIRQYPELSQGLDMDGEGIHRRKKEQFTAIAWEFVHSGIFAELSGSACKTLIAIASLTNKYRNTSYNNRTISRWAGINNCTVKKSLRELEYYHLIKRFNLPGGSRTNRKRMIVLQRWDTAKDMLIEENKIKVDVEGKVNFIMPNAFRK